MIYRGHVPLIVACNHPNGFLDALIIAAYHPRKLYFLARGDAFRNKFLASLLSKLNLIPVYEGNGDRSLATNNQHTSNRCIEILKNNGAILIFPEGVSVNHDLLSPLRKQAARLVHSAWHIHHINNLVVQPVCIAYNTFTKAPKKVQFRYAPPLQKKDFDSQGAGFISQFNNVLAERMENTLRHFHKIPPEKKNLLRVVLAIPALIGYFIHSPLYGLCSLIARAKTKNTAFYDSVLFVLLAVLYPILLIMVTALLTLLTANMLYLLLLIIVPLTGWAYKEYKASLGYYP